MPDRVPIHQLEIHLLHSCNLACNGCQHYTNHKLGGVVPFEVGGAWLRNWAARVRPKRFKLMGGEPLLNKELHRYVRLAHELWPHARRMLTTNALLFQHQGDELKSALLDTKTEILVSRHADAKDQKYTRALEENVAILKAWKVNFRIDEAVLTTWYKGYKGEGDAILPFDDGNPRKSWESCAARKCMQILDNRIWKCPQIAFFGLYTAKFPGVDREAWAPFLNYPGIGLDATDEELREFAAREDESHLCSLCPANPEFYEKPIWPEKRA